MKWRVRCACVLYLAEDVSWKQFKKLQTDLCCRGLQEGISSWQGHIDVGRGSPDWLWGGVLLQLLAWSWHISVARDIRLQWRGVFLSLPFSLSLLLSLNPFQIKLKGIKCAYSAIYETPVVNVQPWHFGFKFMQVQEYFSKNKFNKCWIIADIWWSARWAGEDGRGKKRTHLWGPMGGWTSPWTGAT